MNGNVVSSVETDLLIHKFRTEREFSPLRYRLRYRHDKWVVHRVTNNHMTIVIFTNNLLIYCLPMANPSPWRK